MTTLVSTRPFIKMSPRSQVGEVGERTKKRRREGGREGEIRKTGCVREGDKRIIKDKKHMGGPWP